MIIVSDEEVNEQSFPSDVLGGKSKQAWGQEYPTWREWRRSFWIAFESR